jgi:hypothetical protein
MLKKRNKMIENTDYDLNLITATEGHLILKNLMKKYPLGEDNNNAIVFNALVFSMYDFIYGSVEEKNHNEIINLISKTLYENLSKLKDFKE